MSEMARQLGTGRPLSELLQQEGALSAEVTIRLVRQLAEQVRDLHAQGRIHRAIGLSKIHGEDLQSACLADSPEALVLGGRHSDPNGCPPELAEGDEVLLPADMTEAASLLEKSGRSIDPRRIDVYQLAALLVRLLSTSSVRDYLTSPKARGAIPGDLRPLVDNALGYCPSARIHTIDELLSGLPPERDATGSETPAQGHQPTLAPQGWTGGDEVAFSRLGPYRILGRIGRGGMGDVYRGYDESLDRMVAVKVLPAELSRDGCYVERFKAEAAAAAQVTHPNVVPVYFTGEDAGQHFFVMQYIAGESLSSRLSRPPQLSLEESVDLLLECLAGLEAAHVQGLIHRDVKPGNILLDSQSGRAVLVDFGLVRRMGSGARLTSTGAVMGTVDYIAPEQALGVKLDARADIYALGVVAFQMLSGRLPYEADTPTGVLYQHAHEEPLALAQVAPHVPSPLCRIVARMMAREPENRYRTCGEVTADLRAFCEGRMPSDDREEILIGGGCSHEAPTRPFPRVLAGRRFRWTTLAVLVVGIATAAVGAGAFRGFWHRPSIGDNTAVSVDGELQPNLLELPPGEWIEILQSVKPQRDVVMGIWAVDERGLHATLAQGGRIMLPAAPGDDYSLEVEFTRSAGEGSVALILPVGDRACELTLHGWNGIDGLELIGGLRANENATTRPSGFEGFQRHRVRVDVRLRGSEASIDVLLDGKPHLRWQGEASELSNYFHWQLPDTSRLGLGVWDSEVTFHTARIRRGTSVVAESP